MLTELCQELHNWFCRQMYHGTFVIEDGGLIYPELLDGQYFRIVGSVFNDGVHQYPATGLKDETFDGAVWALGIPQAVVDLANEIKAWRDKYETSDSAAMSPYNSESFGGYSYSKGSTASSANTETGWQKTFASRLSMWRKI